MRLMTVQMMVAVATDDEDVTTDQIAAQLEEELKLIVPSIGVLVDGDRWTVATIHRYHVQRITEQRDEAQRPA